jgi:hypothetical protein
LISGQVPICGAGSVTDRVCLGADRIRNFKPHWTRPDLDEMTQLAGPDPTGSESQRKNFQFFASLEEVVWYHHYTGHTSDPLHFNKYQTGK